MEYIIGKRQVVMNFSEKFCKTENEVLSSDCFADVWGKYVKHLYQTENQAFLKVLKVFPKENKVLVEGVNKVKKHQKPTQANQEGSIVEIEAPIDASNVMLLNPKTNKPVRVGIKFVEDKNGKTKKIRVAKDETQYEFN